MIRDIIAKSGTEKDLPRVESRLTALMLACGHEPPPYTPRCRRCGSRPSSTGKCTCCRADV